VTVAQTVREMVALREIADCGTEHEGDRLHY